VLEINSQTSICKNITTLFYKIPPHLFLPAFGRKKKPKGGKTPLFGKEG